ncbi:MAG: hypothetical protein A2V86_05655 [Deltaproteobacteria bacterium RBG_16_49_23]|nr:MAG: hypothetical protein A2V86_05655 [Deltaproteobacteria bacterium RBG_16_49_23]
MDRRAIIWLSIFLICAFLLPSCSQEPAGIKPNTLPTGSFDAVNYENESFRAVGWAADEEDGSPVKKVTVYVDDKSIGDAKLGFDRPGVATEMKQAKWGKSGWEIIANISLAKGIHVTYAVAMDKKGATSKLFHEKKFEAK